MHRARSSEPTDVVVIIRWEKASFFFVRLNTPGGHTIVFIERLIIKQEKIKKT